MNHQKTSSRPSSVLDIHLGYWMRLVSNHVSGSFARSLQERGVSVAEWVALNQIQMRTDTTAAKLADAMGMTRGAVSKILSKLQEKRWVFRITSEKDNRVQFLSLTTQGKQALPTLTAIANENDAHFFGILDADEQATMRSLLSKLAEAHQMHDIPVD